LARKGILNAEDKRVGTKNVSVSQTVSAGALSGGHHADGAKAPRILVIDDNATILDAFRKILSGHSGCEATSERFEALEASLFGSSQSATYIKPLFDVDLVQSGETGRNLAQQACADVRPYAVAFVDMRMPGGWGGLETIEALWRVDPNIQVVICTAYAEYSWDEIIKRLGQSDRLLILRKPFERIEVLQLACALSEKWTLLRDKQTQMDLLEQRVENRTTELQRQQRLDQQLLENLTEGVIACDASGQLTLMNKTARQWHGLTRFPPERDVRNDLYEADGATPLSRHDTPLARAFRGETFRSVEINILVKDRPRLVVLASGGPILDAGGYRQGAIVTLHDVTETYNNARRFTGLFEFAPDAILMADQNGTIMQVNRQAEVMFGWNRADLLGQPVEMLIPAATAAGHKKLREAYIEAPNPRRMGGGTRDSLPGLRKDGTTFPADISLSPIQSGDGMLVTAFVRDISQRVYSEQVMRESTAMLNAIEDGAFIFDPATLGFSYVNEGAVRMLGFSRNELRAMTPIDICPGLDEQSFRRRVEPLLNNEAGSLSFTTLFQHRSTKQITVEINLQCILMNGGDFRFIALARDVTEREQTVQALKQASEQLSEANLAVVRERELLAERVEERTAKLSKANQALGLAKHEADQANRAKSTFLATMSHEIRTPMNGVIGMLEVLAQSELEGEQVETIDTIRDSAFSLLRIIDDVLDFSKIEAGQLQLERVEVAVPNLVEGVISSLVHFANEKNVDLSLFVDPAVPELQWSDPTRLRQILFNLVGNAIKFSGGRADTRGLVQVRVRAGTDPCTQMRVTVTDNGIGMDEATQKNIFLHFSQAEVSTTRRFGGTGLGLAICKRLIDIMQGSISVDSRPGEGTSFIVSLPVEPVSDGLRTRYEDLAAIDIILVCDSEPDAEGTHIYLEQAGAMVERVSHRDEAARRAERRATPVIVHAAGPDVVTPAQLERDFGHLPDVPHLIISRNPRAPGGADAGNISFLEVSPLRRRSLIRAVAALTGRASPEVDYGDTKENGLGTDTVPRPLPEARAQERLILIAEDDEINQKVILKQLELLGYSGEIAQNGREALQLWRQGDYGLILTDLHMPEMDGYELASIIRDDESGTEHIPIIALTANALRGEEARALMAGMDTYLTKPVQLAVLGAALKKWLGSSRKGTMVSQNADIGTLDIGIMVELLGDDTDTVREFLSDYLKNARGLYAECSEAVAAKDLRQAATIMHKLKSSSRSMGALALGDLCAELENACKAQSTESAQHYVAEIEISLTAVEASIGRLLEGQ
jgi:PAS domain S-box-containing protein